jgi:hypothetical protein
MSKKRIFTKQVFAVRTTIQIKALILKLTTLEAKQNEFEEVLENYLRE